jgi:hypothetical protein
MDMYSGEKTTYPSPRELKKLAGYQRLPSEPVTPAYAQCLKAIYISAKCKQHPDTPTPRDYMICPPLERVSTGARTWPTNSKGIILDQKIERQRLRELYGQRDRVFPKCRGTSVSPAEDKLFPNHGSFKSVYCQRPMKDRSFFLQQKSEEARLMTLEHKEERQKRLDNDNAKASLSAGPEDTSEVSQETQGRLLQSAEGDTEVKAGPISLVEQGARETLRKIAERRKGRVEFRRKKRQIERQSAKPVGYEKVQVEKEPSEDDGPKKVEDLVRKDGGVKRLWSTLMRWC